jgi:hypothetical protein
MVNVALLRLGKAQKVTLSPACRLLRPSVVIAVVLVPLKALMSVQEGAVDGEGLVDGLGVGEEQL